MKFNKKGPNDIDLEVKNGKISKIEKYKYLGDMYDVKGSNKTKIDNRMSHIKYMANEIRHQGSFDKVGSCDVQIRKVLVETTLNPSVLANTETWTEVSKADLKKLDQEQYKVLLIIYEMPRGTPYYGMINETGMWPFSYIVKYKQLMWYHNLIHSDEKRISRRTLFDQMAEESDNWWNQLSKWADEMEIDLKVEHIQKRNKPNFKKYVKEKIKKSIKEAINTEAETKTKMRNLKDDEFEEKIYMKRCKLKQCKQIMKIRLNMTKSKANYKRKNESKKCSAGCNEDDTTEHMIMCDKLDQICGSLKVKDIRKDPKDFDWLEKNSNSISHREEMREIIYKAVQ